MVRMQFAPKAVADQERDKGHRQGDEQSIDLAAQNIPADREGGKIDPRHHAHGHTGQAGYIGLAPVVHDSSQNRDKQTAHTQAVDKEESIIDQGELESSEQTYSTEDYAADAGYVDALTISEGGSCGRRR